MKTQKIFLYATLMITMAIQFSACKKDVKGCTDPSADNHKVGANVDDGSCTHHGNLVAWYDLQTRDSLIANNIASVGVFVDGQVFNNYNTPFIQWSAPPECSTSTLGNWIVMDETKTRTFSLSVRGLDSSNTLVREWNQTLDLNSGECELYEIIW
jgi:hypothetical protein